MCNSKKEEVIVNNALESKVKTTGTAERSDSILIALLCVIIGLLCAIILYNAYKKWKTHIITAAAR